MPASPVDNLARRLTKVRAHVAEASLDAFVVTHLPTVRYLSDLSSTAGALVLAEDRAVLVVDSRYATAARSLPAVVAGLVDVAVCDRSIDETMAAALRTAGAARVGIEAAAMVVARFNRLVGDVGTAEVIATERIVERARIVKDAGEIGTLQEAGRRLSEVARGMRAFAVAGRSEREIAAAIDAALRDAGFERPAFETIAASGPNSALPHARPGPRRLQEGEGLLLDFGGVYDGYCVDLTRTLHLGPRPAALRHLFDAVVEAHAAAIAVTRPGIAASEIDTAARDVLTRHGLGDAFGHGTGHGLGLEIHEEPRVTKTGTATPDAIVEAGMVFTIEPGAYVPGVGGVRIEDDVLVTAEGAELLTHVPIDL